jgi:nucleotide-binding universal stress UspA family protein
MRKILVPTDFSPNALAAFCYAVPFAAQFNADLVVAHVISRPTLPANTPLEVYETVMEGEKQLAWEQMQQQVALKKEALPDDHEVRVIPVVISNTFVKGVNQLVAQENAGLIIMGTKGATGLKRLFVGSNTTDLIEHTPVPLLAIPEKAKYRGMKKILVALNLKHWKGTEPLHLLRRIVRACASTVTILTVVPPGEEGTTHKVKVQAELEEMLEMVPSWVEVKGRDAVASIQSSVDKGKPDLLVLMPQPKSLWQQLFSTSVTYEFVFKPEIPVLVIPARSYDIFSA